MVGRRFFFFSSRRFFYIYTTVVSLYARLIWTARCVGVYYLCVCIAVLSRRLHTFRHGKLLHRRLLSLQTFSAACKYIYLYRPPIYDARVWCTRAWSFRRPYFSLQIPCANVLIELISLLQYVRRGIKTRFVLSLTVSCLSCHRHCVLSVRNEPKDSDSGFARVSVLLLAAVTGVRTPADGSTISGTV